MLWSDIALFFLLYISVHKPLRVSGGVYVELGKEASETKKRTRFISNLKYN